MFFCFCFSSRRRHTRWNCDWSSDVCSSDLPPCAGNLFSKLLLNEGSGVQSRDRIEAGGARNLSGAGVRAGVLPAQLLSLAAERPLTVEHPAIEKKKQAQDSPTSLIRTDLVKMLAVSE